MNKFEEISDHGQEYIVMAINDMIQSNMNNSCSDGLCVGANWLTPESCYWLYKLLSNWSETCLVDSAVLQALKNGTCHPESL